MLYSKRDRGGGGQRRILESKRKGTHCETLRRTKIVVPVFRAKKFAINWCERRIPAEGCRSPGGRRREKGRRRDEKCR